MATPRDKLLGGRIERRGERMDGGGSTGRANTHLPSQGVDVNFVVDFHGVCRRRRRRHRGRAVTIRRGGRGSRMQRHHGRRYGIQRYGRPVDLVIVAPLSLPPPRPPSSRLPPRRPNAAMALSSSSLAARANARARAARLTEADVRVLDPGGTTTTARERAARAYVHARRRHHDCCRRSRASNGA